MQWTKVVLGIIGLVLAVILGANLPSKPAPKERVVINRSPQLNLQRQVWWNQDEKVATLELSDEQREKMNALLREYEAFDVDPAARARSMRAFTTALGQGDWEGARAGAASLAAVASNPVERTSELMIGVFSLLSSEQRDLFVQSYPELMERRWARPPRTQRKPATLPDAGNQ